MHFLVKLWYIVFSTSLKYKSRLLYFKDDIYIIYKTFFWIL